MAERVLDLRGLRCPLPVLRARKALIKAPPGSILLVECTDPMTVIDMPHFASENGYLLEGQEQRDGLYLFRMRKPG